MAPPPRTTSAQERGRWRSEQRAAKREYRRSLPAVYRWRRVIVGLLSVVLVVVVVSVLGRDPVGWLKNRWYDLRGTTEPVAGVEALTRAPGSPRLSPVDEVLDADPATVWQRKWVAGSAPTTSCAKAEQAGYVELRWKPPVRVRMLQVDAGLAEGANDRDLEFRPETILVSYRTASGRVCWGVTIPDTGARRSLGLDTKSDVNRLRVSIGSVFDSTTPDEDGPVSIRRLIVRSRPQ